MWYICNSCDTEFSPDTGYQCPSCGGLDINIILQYLCLTCENEFTVNTEFTKKPLNITCPNCKGRTNMRLKKEEVIFNGS